MGVLVGTEKFTTVISKMPKLVKRNLLKIFDELNNQYFDCSLCAGIRWKKMRIGKRSITLAQAKLDERIIEVNLLLRDSRIPLWYLRTVVYHEMLHLMQGPQEDPHNGAFCRLEAEFPDYPRSIEFELSKLRRIANDWVTKK